MKVSMKGLEPVVELLKEMTEDRTIPRNVRRVAERGKQILLDEKSSLELRVSSVIQLFDETTNDPNLPIHARTRIWNVLSLLEQVRREA